MCLIVWQVVVSWICCPAGNTSTACHLRVASRFKDSHDDSGGRHRIDCIYSRSTAPGPAALRSDRAHDDDPISYQHEAQTRISELGARLSRAAHWRLDSRRRLRALPGAPLQMLRSRRESHGLGRRSRRVLLRVDLCRCTSDENSAVEHTTVSTYILYSIETFYIRNSCFSLNIFAMCFPANYFECFLFPHFQIELLNQDIPLQRRSSVGPGNDPINNGEIFWTPATPLRIRRPLEFLSHTLCCPRIFSFF